MGFGTGKWDDLNELHILGRSHVIHCNGLFPEPAVKLGLGVWQAVPFVSVDIHHNREDIQTSQDSAHNVWHHRALLAWIGWNFDF